MYKIGLTGGIGVGKTTVSNIFKTYNIPIIDADEISKELTLPDTRYYDLIIEKFGKNILLGNELNRKKIRSIIFNDQEKKIWLEELLHPPIIAEIVKRSDNVDSIYCIIVIPLLIEKNLQHLVDSIFVISTNNTYQKDRTQQRDKISQELFQSIKQSQIDEEQLVKHADEIIFNNGNKQELKQKIALLHTKYSNIAMNKSA